MVKIIAVNGFPQSGKTTFEDNCLAVLGAFGSKYSSIDFVKQIATECGWNGEKTPETRKFLSDLKVILEQAPWGDVLLEKIKQQCRLKQAELNQFDLDDATHYMFVDIREPHNLEKIKREMDAWTLLIRRADDQTAQAEAQNSSDTQVLDYYYDMILYNDGSLEDWQNKAYHFADNLLKKSTNSYIIKENK